MNPNGEDTGRTWEAQFVDGLRRGLATIEARGQLSVERADIEAGEVITILQLTGAPPHPGGSPPALPPTRHGRVVSVVWLRSMFTPDRAGGVADAWLDALYPPGHPDPTTLVDGVHWFQGRTPGMTPDQIDQLPTPTQQPPPPNWQDDLPLGIRAENLRLSRSDEPRLPPPG